MEGKGTEVLFVLSNLMMKVTVRDERVTIYASSPSRLLIKLSVPTTPQHWAATRTKSHLLPAINTFQYMHIATLRSQETRIFFAWRLLHRLAPGRRAHIRGKL